MMCRQVITGSLIGILMWVVLGLVACPSPTDVEPAPDGGVIQEVVTPDATEPGQEPSPQEPQVEPSTEPVVRPDQDAGPVEPAPDTAPPKAEVIPEVKVELPPETKVEAPPTTTGKSFTIPKAGGSFCYNHVCVVVPASAVPRAGVVLRLKEAKQAPKGSVLPAMDVGPDNWLPVDDVFIEFNGGLATLPPNVQASQLVVAFARDGEWVPVPSVSNPRTAWVQGTTPHFSVWGLVPQGNNCGQDSDCFGRQVCLQGVCQPKVCTKNADCGANRYCSAKGACQYKPCVLTAERCNSIDDNCDGQIDEGCKTCQSAADCQQGEVCDMVKKLCVSQVCKASQEVCDGKDNNCDGQVDEGCNKCPAQSTCSSGEVCVDGVCL